MSVQAAKRILMLRRPRAVDAVAARLIELGHVVEELPAIDIEPPADQAALDEAIERLERYDWMVFTSAMGVRFTLERMRTLKGPGVPRLPAKLKVASVGPATSEVFHECFESPVHLQPDQDYRAEGLVHAFSQRGSLFGQRFLLPLGDRARSILADGLRNQGAQVDVVVAYRTVKPAGFDAALSAHLANPPDLIVLSSPSTVEHLVSLEGVVPPLWSNIHVAVMGPITERAAREAGLSVRAVARPSTAQGLILAIQQALTEA
ncbi:MAG: uroporphyrinogen-III synthase [Vicinamibacteria bacterium]|nr:uroporphyrinogen-III synthase [Vicinamibacteria bacterium]